MQRASIVPGRNVETGEEKENEACRRWLWRLCAHPLKSRYPNCLMGCNTPCCIQLEAVMDFPGVCTQSIAPGAHIDMEALGREEGSPQLPPPVYPRITSQPSPHSRAARARLPVTTHRQLPLLPFLRHPPQPPTKRDCLVPHFQSPKTLWLRRTLVPRLGQARPHWAELTNRSIETPACRVS